MAGVFGLEESSTRVATGDWLRAGQEEATARSSLSAC
jgi:hypothetical protein